MSVPVMAYYTDRDGARAGAREMTCGEFRKKHPELLAGYDEPLDTPGYEVFYTLGPCDWLRADTFARRYTPVAAPRSGCFACGGQRRMGEGDMEG